MSLLQSEFITLQAAIESSNGVLPTTGWKAFQPEPGGVQDFYPDIKKLARSPLSSNLMDEKGDAVDLDAHPSLVHDLNMDLLMWFAESMYRSATKWPGSTGTGRWINATGFGAQVTAVTGTAYTVSTGGALPQNTLVYGVGFGVADNNGLHVVGVGSTGTSIVVAGVSAEASPPANARLYVVGLQGVANDIAVTVSGSVVQITSAASIFANFIGANNGLNVGQWGWLGGGTAASPGLLGFGSGASPDRGPFRITAAANGALTIDRTSAAFTADPGSGGKTIQIFFGPWVRNVPGVHTDYKRTSHSLELVMPGVGSGNVTDYVYAIGCGLGTFEVNCPLTSKAVATLGFVGFDVQDPTTTRQTGASSGLAPLDIAALNTVNEMKRLRVTNTDGTSVLVDIESWKLSINHNVKPYKKQGTFGAADLIYGKFQVGLAIDGAIAQDDTWKAVRDNRTVMFEALIRNNDCGALFDLPAMTVEGAAPKFDAQDVAMFSPSAKTFRDPTYNFVSALTMFPYLPSS